MAIRVMGLSCVNILGAAQNKVWDFQNKQDYSNFLSQGQAQNQLRSSTDNSQALKELKEVYDKKKETKSMFKEFKTFLGEHRDLIFTTVLLMVADSFFLNGALRAKLTSILQGVVTKLEKKVEG